jgi:hypothetical protein
MEKQYNFILSEIRASEQDGKRYARVRAIANGEDSYRSIFTEKARESIIRQILQNGVNSKFLHADAVWQNIDSYLEARAANADAKEKEYVQRLKAQLPMTRPPIGKPVSAKFLDDNTIEVLIEENVHNKSLGEVEAKFHESAWQMIMDNTVKGVSTVFHSVKSFMQGGKLFIDDLILTGLDFVDKPAHPDTKVMEVFVRAAQDSYTPQGVREPKMAEINPVEIEKVVATAVETKLQEAQAKAKAQAEAQAAEAARLKEINDKIQALESEKARLSSENAELADIAKQAVDRLQQAKTTVASKVNPYANAVASAVSEQDPLKGKSLGELFAMQTSIKQ